nr:hypothetical protein CFP56_28507 [Quercus suber]
MGGGKLDQLELVVDDRSSHRGDDGVVVIVGFVHIVGRGDVAGDDFDTLVFQVVDLVGLGPDGIGGGEDANLAEVLFGSEDGACDVLANEAGGPEDEDVGGFGRHGAGAVKDGNLSMPAYGFHRGRSTNPPARGCTPTRSTSLTPSCQPRLRSRRHRVDRLFCQPSRERRKDKGQVKKFEEHVKATGGRRKRVRSSEGRPSRHAPSDWLSVAGAHLDQPETPPALHDERRDGIVETARACCCLQLERLPDVHGYCRLENSRSGRRDTPFPLPFSLRSQSRAISRHIQAAGEGTTIDKQRLGTACTRGELVERSLRLAASQKATACLAARAGLSRLHDLHLACSGSASRSTRSSQAETQGQAARTSARTTSRRSADIMVAPRPAPE